MRDKVTKTIVGVLALVAMALGGAAIAGAQSDQSQGSGSTTQQGERPEGKGGHGGPGGGREGESELTGANATKARAAALAKVPGATIERLETDADGATYEAHIVKRDGTGATVKMDRQFKVTSVEDGRR